MLELKNIIKDYGNKDFKVRALNGVSLAFRSQEFVSILGPSGCGKTTLLNIIGGLDHYTEGDLIIKGTSTKEYKDAAWDAYRNHSIGFVFQTYNLISHQNVLSNVEIALTINGLNKKERREKAIKALENVGLADQIYKKPNQLSGGQMQRVAIARALVNDPEILLADEPTGALDSKTSIQVMEILKEIAKTRLVIMVTHNPELANNYSTRIINLLDGQVISDSNPYEEIDSKQSYDKAKKNRSMSFFTALSLSFNNLMTKRGRTILTAFAGSIGIIGIALILSVSQGVTRYIDTVEESTMGSYPLTIESSAVQLSTDFSTFEGYVESENTSGEIESYNIVVSVLDNMTIKENDLSKFKAYLEASEEIKDYTTDIVYNYDLSFDTYYKEANDEYVETINSYEGVITYLVTKGLRRQTSGNNQFIQQLVGDEEFMKGQYDLVAGNYPTSSSDVLLLVDKNNRVSDFTLYCLGLKDLDELIDYYTRKEEYEKTHTDTFKEEMPMSHFTYDELLGYELKLVLDVDNFKLDGDMIVEKSKQELTNFIDNAYTIRICGIVKPSEENQNPMIYGNLFYTSELQKTLIDRIEASDVVSAQRQNPTHNMVYDHDFGVEYVDSDYDKVKNLINNNATLFYNFNKETGADINDVDYVIDFANRMMQPDLDAVLTYLGYIDYSVPESISIYAKDFASKDKIVEFISEYNNKAESIEDKITYTDLMGILLNSVTIIVNAISYVLIAFVSISLIVSSIMIGIITYISVLERTKEIGILRAIGASKRDISRIFNAETITVGFTAGVFGIIISLILIIPINIILHALSKISYLSAYLPPLAGVILIIISIVLTLIAGLIPASLASRKDPVVALRTE